MTLNDGGNNCGCGDKHILGEPKKNWTFYLRQGLHGFQGKSIGFKYYLNNFKYHLSVLVLTFGGIALMCLDKIMHLLGLGCLGF